MTSKRTDENCVEPAKSGKKKRKTEPSGFVPNEVNPAYGEGNFKQLLGEAFRNQESFEHGELSFLSSRLEFSCVYATVFGRGMTVTYAVTKPDHSCAVLPVCEITSRTRVTVHHPTPPYPTLIVPCFWGEPLHMHILIGLHVTFFPIPFLTESGATLLRYPFSCCILPNFVKDDSHLKGLKDELLDLPFEEKSNDLYKFQQSGALQNVSSPHIIGLRNFLYENFLAWLREVTGIPLDDTVDMTCSKYNYTDSLLCHDDELGGRRIAFILYLVPPWEEKDGGALDLFKVDEHGQPSQVVKSLLPKWNNFVFFEVTPVSFHQVAEVLAQDKCRLSVSGWFHGPPVDRPAPYVEPRLALQSHCTLQTDKYELVSKAVASSDIRWQRIGPANKRNYERADVSTLPQILLDCLNVLRSEHMFLTLSNFTGLKLHEHAPNNDSDDDSDDDRDEREDSSEEEADKESRDEDAARNASAADGTEAEEGIVIVSKPTPYNPRCRAEVRRWSHGCYTLLHDTDTEGSEFALDAVIHFGCPPDWQTDHGGYISYIAKAEDEELLSVGPESNGLSLVYRDKETLKFVKHLNHRFTECSSEGDGEPAIYDIQLVYYE